jgi:hypothetical protein
MRSSRAALAVLGLAVLGACEYPTEAPLVDQRWVLPVESSTISVNQLLPGGVTVAGNAFSVNVSAFNTSRTLGELCPSCAPLQGLPAPVPAFNATFTLTQSLPADVVQATVTSGSVAIAINNGFNFDPLAGGGSVTVTLRNGASGPAVGQTVFTGAFPAGQTRTQTLTINPGALGSSLVASTEVNSPGGQVTTIDNNQRLTVTATPSPILVSSARVNVANRSVSFDAVDLDVEDIDSAITDRIQGGSIILEITNPFGVSVAANVSISRPSGGPLTKPLAIGSGATSTGTLAYTGDELRSFLGKSGVRLTGTGTVSASAGAVTVTPGQQVSIRSKLDVTLRIGG